MWIFTQHGFFSAVACELDRLPKGEAARLDLDPETEHIMVRARVEEDIQNLVLQYEEVFETEGPEILAWGNRDYPYRVILPAYEWAILCSSFADEIDYPNFKSRVKVEQGEARSDLYMRVWGCMNNAEEKLERIEERNARRRAQSKRQGSFWGNWYYGGNGKHSTPVLPPKPSDEEIAEAFEDEDGAGIAEDGRVQLPEGTHYTVSEEAEPEELEPEPEPPPELKS